eukprot:gene7857-37521_t
MAAAMGGHVAVAELLLKGGADANARSNDGHTALSLALSNPRALRAGRGEGGHGQVSVLRCARQCDKPSAVPELRALLLAHGKG